MKVTAVSPQKGPLTTKAKIFGSGLRNGTPGSGDPPDVTVGGTSHSRDGDGYGRLGIPRSSTPCSWVRDVIPSLGKAR